MYRIFVTLDFKFHWDQFNTKYTFYFKIKWHSSSIFYFIKTPYWRVILATGNIIFYIRQFRIKYCNLLSFNRGESSARVSRLIRGFKNEDE